MPRLATLAHAAALAALLVPLDARPEALGRVRAGSEDEPSGAFPALFPIRRCADGARFFQQGAKLFGAFTASGAEDRGSVYTELVSDTGLCVVRFALGVAVAKGSGGATGDPAAAAAPTATQKETLQRIVGGGGNAVLSTAVPLLFLKPRTADQATWLGVFAVPKVGLDIPMLSTTNDASALADLGAEAHGIYTTDNKRFAFEAQVRASWMVMTHAYERSLGYGRSFGLVRGTAGIDIPGYFDVSVAFLVRAPREVRDIMPGVVVGVGMTR